MVAERLNAVRQRMRAAAENSGRDVAGVTLVAVSKGRSRGDIMAAYDAGQRVFGENRAAELAAKAPALPEDIGWHFIGSLQTRQAKLAQPHTSLLHSLDRVRLANVWSAAEEIPQTLVQVNVAAEPQKHGVAPEAVDQLLNHARGAGIECVGLMTMAPLNADPEDSREWFRALRLLRDDLQPSFPDLVELSMGMTDDYGVAIEEGATIIRVGRAIFGPPGAPALSD
jgi:pyridoxal phosphate enzyme (YggS family)